MDSSRRVIRLVIGLVLVLVVMKQASQEAIYRPFFGSSATSSSPVGVPQAGQSTSGGGGQAFRANDSNEAVVDAANEKLIADELSRVVDGSVWRGDDFDAFYRSLDRADAFQSDRATGVGVIPLLQQPDVFLGKTVRISGSVARAEKLDARENSFGITDYWQLWLRPLSGANRPIVAIVTDVPENVAGVAADATRDDGPPVEVVGIFLKRLAYQSALGADLAPVIAGRIENLAVSPDPNNIPIQSPASDFTIDRKVIFTLFAAILIGVLLAAIAVWRTSVAARRSRRLRALGQRPDSSFFSGLQTDAKDSPS